MWNLVSYSNGRLIQSLTWPFPSWWASRKQLPSRLKGNLKPSMCGSIKVAINLNIQIDETIAHTVISCKDLSFLLVPHLGTVQTLKQISALIFLTFYQNFGLWIATFQDFLKWNINADASVLTVAMVTRPLQITLSVAARWNDVFDNKFPQWNLLFFFLHFF